MANKTADLDLGAFDVPRAQEVARGIVESMKRPTKDPSRPQWFVRDKPIYRATRLEPLVHGDSYGVALLKAIAQARRYVLITAWAIDPDFRLARIDGKPPGQAPLASSIAGALVEAQKLRRVEVRILEWRNPLTLPSRATNMSLALLRAAGIPTRQTLVWPVMHQKTVVIDGHVAFCGGIDLTDLGGDKWDTDRHVDGDKRRSKPPFDAGNWHDVQVRVEGHAVRGIQENFADRWDEGQSRVQPEGLPELEWNPRGRSSSASVQVIRSIPKRDSSWSSFGLATTDPDAAPVPDRDLPKHADEEYTTLESYGRAIVNARRFIYIENQYFSCKFLIDVIKARLVTVPELAVIVLVPRKSELAAEGEQLRRQLGPRMSRAIAGESEAASKLVTELRGVAPERVFVACPLNGKGKAIYVHAKVMIVDDIYATIGSANLTYRSMYRTDQELGVAWVDAEGTSVRELRERLWSEHLELDAHELRERVTDAKSMAALWRARAEDPDWKVRRVAEWSVSPPAKK